jgi:major capsid protein gp7
MAVINVSITTPIPLIEYAKTLSQDNPARTFVENMVENSDVMRAIMFKPVVMGKASYLDIAALPTVGFRGINEAGGEATGNYNLREEDTFFIDEYVKVDRAVVDRLGPEHRAKQEKLKTISLGQMFSQNLVKGDNSLNPRQPNGFQVRCNTLTVNLIHNSVAAGGAALSLANLDQLYWLVNKPTHYIVPRGLMPFFDVAARSNSLTNTVVSFEKDDFGRVIIKYKGLPLLFGYEPDDSPDLLPFTEVGAGGGGAVTSSIYCVSFRDGGCYAIEQTPLNVEDEGMIKGTPFMSTHIKWDWGVAKEHPRSVARLTSITAATIVA